MGGVVGVVGGVVSGRSGGRSGKWEEWWEEWEVVGVVGGVVRGVGIGRIGSERIERVVEGEGEENEGSGHVQCTLKIIPFQWTPWKHSNTVSLAHFYQFPLC